jgi:probable RNA-binding protein EIF1AD
MLQLFQQRLDHVYERLNIGLAVSLGASPDDIDCTTLYPAKMPRPKRDLHATVENTIIPPDSLEEGQSIARIDKATGNNVYNVKLPGGKHVLVELGEKFRSRIWVKRGSYVVVDTNALAERENKLAGEIVNVVRDEKQWRKMSYWCVCEPSSRQSCSGIDILLGQKNSRKNPHTLRTVMRKSP